MNESVLTAMGYAKRLKKSGEIDDCHLLAHFIGEAQAEKVGDITIAFLSCPESCIQGCLHGVMEAHVATLDRNGLEQDVTSLCAVHQGNLQRQCFHGVGHGLLANGYMSLTEAIEMCDSGEAFFGEQCLLGLFMENMDQHLLSDRQTLEQAIPNICYGIPDQYWNICIDAIGEGIMFYTGHNLKESLALCELLAESDHKTCKDAVRFENLVVAAS